MTITTIRDRDSVLVLEYEPRIIAAIDEVLEDYYRIIEETAPAAVLEPAQSSDPAAAMLRHRRTPDASGADVLKKVVELTDATRVLVAGYADMHSVIRAADEADIYGHLAKPWPESSLLGTLTAAVEACKLYRALLKERARFDDLMHSIPDGAFIKDDKGRFLRLNSAETRNLGLGAASDAIGMTLHELVAPDIEERWGEDERNLLGGQRRARSTLREVSRPDGSVGYYAVNLAARRNSAGEVTGLLGLSRDVTEEQRIFDASYRDQYVPDKVHLERG